MLNGTVQPISQVAIEEIVHDFVFYLQRVEEGETLVITRTGQPVMAIQPILHGTTDLRPFGLCVGAFEVPTDFDDPLPEELLVAFEGS